MQARKKNKMDMERKNTYKPRTRSEISAWLERARQRKAVWEKKMQEIFASEEKQKKGFSAGINSLSGAWRSNGLYAEEEIRQIYVASTSGETRTLLDL